MDFISFIKQLPNNDDKPKILLEKLLKDLRADLNEKQVDILEQLIQHLIQNAKEEVEAEQTEILKKLIQQLQKDIKTDIENVRKAIRELKDPPRGKSIENNTWNNRRRRKK